MNKFMKCILNVFYSFLVYFSFLTGTFGGSLSSQNTTYNKTYTFIIYKIQ